VLLDVRKKYTKYNIGGVLLNTLVFPQALVYPSPNPQSLKGRYAGYIYGKIEELKI